MFVLLLNNIKYSTINFDYDNINLIYKCSKFIGEEVIMYNIKNLNLISEIKSQIDKYDVISFDIFDTLLLRAYAKPDDLFRHVEMLSGEEDFAPKRGYAYEIARGRNPERNEITFDQIYEVLGPRFDYVKKQELEMEESVLTANPEMLEIFDYAKAKGKKIIIISDMYLSGDFLDKVLQNKGYIGYDKLYVSADINKTKRSGELYKHVLEDLSIAPDKMIHIGDNHGVDCVVASHLGISSFYYEKIIDRFFRLNQKNAIFYQNNIDNIAASIITGVSAIKSLTCENDYWKNFGYDCAGPAAYGYTEWLSHNFMKDGIKEALFVARDGYTLKRIFDLFQNNDITSHYFYSPRILYKAIVLSPDTLSVLEQDKLKDMRVILDYYRHKHPYLQANTPEISTSTEGISFIQANNELYRGLVTKEIIKFLDYIKSENIKGDNIALVDAQSFSLTSQKLLTMFMPKGDVHGYYWRYLRSTSYENPKFYCKAFESAVDLNKNWAVMEFIITAPEPPIVSIADKKPVYLEDLHEFEKIRIEKYSFVSDGAVEFAKDILKYFHGQSVFIDLKIISALIDTFEKYPTQEDINTLTQVKMDMGSGYAEYRDLFDNWPNTKVKV